MKESNKKNMEWCETLATLTVDELVDYKLVQKDKFDEAVKIVAQEIYIRVFCLNDYPPPFSEKLLKESARE